MDCFYLVDFLILLFYFDIALVKTVFRQLPSTYLISLRISYLIR